MGEIGERLTMSDKMTRVLLALRDGVRSWPYRVRGILSDIPRQTVEYNIKKLEEDGTVKGYIPIVKPEAFGEPYLVKLAISPSDYQFEKDAEIKIDAIAKFFSDAIDLAPVSFFVFLDEQNRMSVNCVVITRNSESLIERLSVGQNIAREDIAVDRLDRVDGIPNYGKHSLLQEGQEIES